MGDSSKDIGWLQRDPSMPPVSDGTQRFSRILNSVRIGVHKLPKSLFYLLVPGLGSNSNPLTLVNTKTHLTNMGLSCDIAKIDSQAPVKTNAEDLKDQIEEIYMRYGKCVVLLGHSKGGVDAAAALSIYWFDLKYKVAGFVAAQSPYGGTPVASDLLDPAQPDGPYKRALQALVDILLKGDKRCLEDLTYDKRREFLKEHMLPEEIPVVSFHTEADTSGKPKVMSPSSAALIESARAIETKYGEKSDGLVTRRDAEVPGSVVVRLTRKLDHQWLVVSSSDNGPGDASSEQMCEALLQFVLEIGQT